MPDAGFKSVFRSMLSYCDNSAGYIPDQHFGDTPGDVKVLMESSTFGLRKFRYGTFDVASGTPSDGDMLCYNDNLKLTFTTVGSAQGSRNRPAGACIAANAGGPSAYVVLNSSNSSLGNQIWVQYSGFHQNLTFTGSPVIGDIGVMSGTDKTLSGVTANTAPTNVPVCVILANVSAGKCTAAQMIIPD